MRYAPGRAFWKSWNSPLKSEDRTCSLMMSRKRPEKMWSGRTTAEVICSLQVSVYSIDMSKPEGERGVRAQGGDEELDQVQTYTIVTNNYVALGDDFSTLKVAPEINQYGACDEAIAAFIREGQDIVDKATGTEWLTEIPDEDNGTWDRTVTDDGTSDDKQNNSG